MTKPNEHKSTNKEPIKIPYVAHESMMYRLERTNKRLWIALVIALILLLISIVR
jgi:type IV secretory pathway component VirB8